MIFKTHKVNLKNDIAISFEPSSAIEYYGIGITTKNDITDNNFIENVSQGLVIYINNPVFDENAENMEIVNNTLIIKNAGNKICGEDVQYLQNGQLASQQGKRINGEYQDLDLATMSDGTEVFVKIDKNPTSLEYFTDEQGTWEKKPYYDCDSTFLTDENNELLQLQTIENDIYFINESYTVKRNLADENGYIVSFQQVLDKQTKTTYENDFDDYELPYRCRFVISNYGRSLTYSIFDKNTNTYKTKNQCIFSTDKITEDITIVLTTNSTEIYNISSNF